MLGVGTGSQAQKNNNNANARGNDRLDLHPIQDALFLNGEQGFKNKEGHGQWKICPLFF